MVQIMRGTDTLSIQETVNLIKAKEVASNEIQRTVNGRTRPINAVHTTKKRVH